MLSEERLLERYGRKLVHFMFVIIFKACDFKRLHKQPDTPTNFYFLKAL